MTHLRPIGPGRCHEYCFGHGIAMSYSFRPSVCVDATYWFIFLPNIEESFSILVYFGYCSPLSFITHTASMDFLPLAGLRGVTTYYLLFVMGQFDQY